MVEESVDFKALEEKQRAELIVFINAYTRRYLYQPDSCCDCGAVKAKTTHVGWCSTNKRNEVVQ